MTRLFELMHQCRQPKSKLNMVTSLNSLNQSTSQSKHLSHCFQILFLAILRNFFWFCSRSLDLLLEAQVEQDKRALSNSFALEQARQIHRSVSETNYKSASFNLFSENKLESSNDPIIKISKNMFPSMSNSKVSNQCKSNMASAQPEGPDAEYLGVVSHLKLDRKRTSKCDKEPVPSFLLVHSQFLSFLLFQLHQLSRLPPLSDQFCPCILRDLFGSGSSSISKDAFQNFFDLTAQSLKAGIFSFIQTLTRYHSKLPLYLEPEYNLTSVSRKLLTSNVWFVTTNYKHFLQKLETEFERLTSSWTQSVHARSTAAAPTGFQLDVVCMMLGTLEHFLRVWQLRIQFFECKVLFHLETCLKFLVCTFVFQSERFPLLSKRNQVLRRLLLCVAVLCSSEFCDGRLAAKEKKLQDLMTLTMLNGSFVALLENLYFCADHSAKCVIWGFFAKMLGGDFKNEVALQLRKLSVLEVSAHHLEEGIGDAWELFMFWNGNFSFLVNREKSASEKVTSFFKNLIFKLKIENKGDSQRLLQIEKFKNQKLAVFQ